MKIKNLYLLFITIIGLISLIMYTTYAMFTASVDLGDFVNLTISTLPTDTNVIEYERLTLNVGETKTIDLNITNFTDGSLYYGVWYEMIEPTVINDDITIAKLDSSVSDTIGQLSSSVSSVVTLILKNNTENVIVINLGVGYSESSSLNLPSDRNIINDVANNNPVPNSPGLTIGMVPVTYKDNKWVKADSGNANNSWYNYSNKQWANAVFVSDIYRNADGTDKFNVGEEVPEQAILAYYVWIPRYKYKVWNINKEIGTDSYGAYNKGIDIVFEKENETTGTINCTTTAYSFSSPTETTPNETCVGSDGEYYTHPAFWWDNNGNNIREASEEVRGIWVGKFEISTPSDSTCHSNTTTDNCRNTTLAVRIKPNANPWRQNYLTNFNYVIQNMQKSNNEYGLTSDRTKVDSHMIKNMEWGAMAYLTHSEYGRCSNGECEEVAVNNYYVSSNQGYKTGCGPQSLEVTGTNSGSVCNVYNSTTTKTIVEGSGEEVVLSQTNSDTYPWVENEGVLSSGNSGINNTTSTLTYTFTLSQSGALMLDYAVSSRKNYDKLTIQLDDTILVNGISGVAHGKVENSLEFDSVNSYLSAGSHTLTISFTKTTTSPSGLDKAYIKNIKVLQGAKVTEITVPIGPTASTTGNVYGIYDMSGCSYENAMGNQSMESGTYTYNVSSSSSGEVFTYNTSNRKYIDTYAYGTIDNDQIGYNRARLGDATGEVVITASTSGGWYGDYSSFVDTTFPWFSRGGYYSVSPYTGVFGFYGYNGSSGGAYSTRAVLLVF